MMARSGSAFIAGVIPWGIVQILLNDPRSGTRFINVASVLFAEGHGRISDGNNDILSSVELPKDHCENPSICSLFISE
jgi:hypothetical protein